MEKSHMLEALNGGFFVLSLCAFLIFGHYIWTHRRFGYRVLQPALALSCIFAGETFLRAYLWYIRDHINSGINLNADPMLVASSSGLAAIGVLCAIRVFSPEEWGNKAWVTSSVLAGLFMIITLLD